LAIGSSGRLHYFILAIVLALALRAATNKANGAALT
jgi:hypothetical protein